EQTALTEALPDHVWTALADGTVDYANGRCLTYVGRSREEGIGRWEDHVHPDDLSLLLESWSRSVELRTSLDVELRLRRADGEYRWHLFRASPVRDPGQRVTSLVGTNTDLDERKRTELRLSCEVAVARALAESSTPAEAAPRLLEGLAA